MNPANESSVVELSQAAGTAFIAARSHSLTSRSAAVRQVLTGPTSPTRLTPLAPLTTVQNPKAPPGRNMIAQGRATQARRPGYRPVNECPLPRSGEGDQGDGAIQHRHPKQLDPGPMDA